MALSTSCQAPSTVFWNASAASWACASRSRSRPRSLPPSKRGSAAPGPRRRCRRGRCPGCPVAAPAARCCRQGDARIEIALGHADRGHRGMQARLRLADVGTPLGQLAGQAHRHPHRTAGMGASVSSRACSACGGWSSNSARAFISWSTRSASGGTAASMAAAWASAWDTSSSVATPSRCRSRVSARLRLALSSVWRSTASWFWAPRSRM